jgi:DNA-binding NarL/FixJ family response regulator
MFLAVRPAVPEDLLAAFAFLKVHYHIPDAHRKDLVKMWGQILVEADCGAPVVEDTDQPEGERVAAFGLNFSVPEAVMDYARKDAPPHLWRWTLARWKRGQPVWLNRKEARKAQVDEGVSFFGFSAIDRARYPGLERARLTGFYTAAIAAEMARHRIRDYVTEVYGVELRDRVAAHGMKLSRDYREFETDPEFSALPAERKPYLMIADYKKAAEHTGVARAALIGSPKFGFSDPEQETIKLALLGLTDQVIADKLGLTLVAIKKRWEGIYEKVNEKAFARAWEKSSDDEVAKLGRRQVLQMMAEHPEEFWPSAPKKRAAR